MDSVRKHRHHFQSGASQRRQLFTSFISLIIFLFLLIVVLLLSPHVHGADDFSEQDGLESRVDFDDERDSHLDEEITVRRDLLEERLDAVVKKAVEKVASARIKHVEKAVTPKEVKTGRKLKTSQYELMSKDEIRELLGLMEDQSKDRKKKVKSVKMDDKTISRRDSNERRPQRPREPHDPPNTSR